MSAPFLLRAFRPDNKLYHRALRIYYEVNTFVLDRRERRHFDALSPSTAAYIHHLEFHLDLTW